nr:Sec-independent translocase component C [Cyanidium sp. THAL103]
MKPIHKQNDPKIPLSEHLLELRQRSLQSCLMFSLSVIFCLININKIIDILQIPAKNVHFFQLAPGEYFFTSMKVIFYSSLIITSPFLIYQILIFILPGLTNDERKIVIPIIGSSFILFISGLLFAYLIIIPASLNFFIQYSDSRIDLLWSFEEYFNFILLSLISTGISFQIPIIQISLGLIRIIDSNNMMKFWKEIVIASTIFSAIITPSTDPLTQILVSIIMLILYFSGILVLRLVNF